MQTDRCTDMTKLILAFRNFAKASKMKDKGQVALPYAMKKRTGVEAQLCSFFFPSRHYIHMRCKNHAQAALHPSLRIQFFTH
jgi:hypothetical protein